jgi:uncharacterized OB-fold protein
MPRHDVDEDEDWEPDEDESRHDEGPDSSDLDEDDDDNDVDTVPCPHCGKPVYEQGQRCPHCGRYFSQDAAVSRKAWWLIITAVVLAAAFVWLAR